MRAQDPGYVFFQESIGIPEVVDRVGEREVVDRLRVFLLCQVEVSENSGTTKTKTKTNNTSATQPQEEDHHTLLRRASFKEILFLICINRKERVHQPTREKQATSAVTEDGQPRSAVTGTTNR